jgi:hypothetical protein
MRGRALVLLLVVNVVAGCAEESKGRRPPPAPSSQGGSGGSAGPGSPPGEFGGLGTPDANRPAEPPPGAGGSGGGGAGGSADATVPGAEGDAGAPADGSSPSPPSGPINYGKVGELVLVPLQHTATPVPPMIASECPGDPTEGFSEYQDSFVIQRPKNLAAADRFKYDNGIYTFWVQSNDQSHKADSTTAPRTEARYSDISTGEHIFSADVMFESPSKTCVMQIHNVIGAIAVYLRVEGNEMFNLSTRKTILTDSTGKWFNLKVAFNTQTREVRTYINNCLKETSKAPTGTPFWYFKHGVYTCESGTCRSNYKNIHLYQKGSTDKFNTKSTYP